MTTIDLAFDGTTLSYKPNSIQQLEATPVEGNFTDTTSFAYSGFGVGPLYAWRVTFELDATDRADLLRLVRAHTRRLRLQGTANPVLMSFGNRETPIYTRFEPDTSFALLDSPPRYFISTLTAVRVEEDSVIGSPGCGSEERYRVVLVISEGAPFTAQLPGADYDISVASNPTGGPTDFVFDDVTNVTAQQISLATSFRAFGIDRDLVTVTAPHSQLPFFMLVVGPDGTVYSDDTYQGGSLEVTVGPVGLHTVAFGIARDRASFILDSGTVATVGVGETISYGIVSATVDEDTVVENETMCTSVVLAEPAIDFGEVAVVTYEWFANVTGYSAAFDDIQVRKQSYEWLLNTPNPPDAYNGPFSADISDIATIFFTNSAVPFRANRLRDADLAVVNENGSITGNSPQFDNGPVIIEQRPGTPAEIVELGGADDLRRSAVIVEDRFHISGNVAGNYGASNYLRWRITYTEIETFNPGPCTGTYQTYRQEIILWKPDFPVPWVLKFEHSSPFPTYDSCTGRRSGNYTVESWPSFSDNGVQDGTILQNVDGPPALGDAFPGILSATDTTVGPADQAAIDALVGSLQPGIIRKAKVAIGGPVAF